MNSCVVSQTDDSLKERAMSYVVPKVANPQRVVVAMSGGVDSSVAAWLLKEAGHEVIGVSLRLAPDETSSLQVRHGRCCSVDDMTDARQVCNKLGIPFYAIDSRERFRSVVFDPFVKAYRAGQTPIPCLACNHQVKFGEIIECPVGNRSLCPVSRL
jgi:tRNA-uridine 2-sulfurtransferase